MLENLKKNNLQKLKTKLRRKSVKKTLIHELLKSLRAFI